MHAGYIFKSATRVFFSVCYTYYMERITRLKQKQLESSPACSAIFSPAVRHFLWDSMISASDLKSGSTHLRLFLCLALQITGRIPKVFRTSQCKHWWGMMQVWSCLRTGGQVSSCVPHELCLSCSMLGTSPAVLAGRLPVNPNPLSEEAIQHGQHKDASAHPAPSHSISKIFHSLA